MKRSALVTLLLLVIIKIYTACHVYALTFMRDYSARAAGVAGSYCCLVDNSDAVLWNPAGLCGVEGTVLSFMYGRPYINLTDDNLGYNCLNFAAKSKPFGSTFGIAWAQFNLGDVYKQEIVALSAGRYLDKNGKVACGITMKNVGHKINYGYTAADSVMEGYADNKYTISFDAGVNFRFNTQLKTSLVIRDINEPDLGLVVADNIYREIRLGMSYGPMNLWFFNEIQPAAEVLFYNNKTGLLFGLEGYIMNKMLCIRAGISDVDVAVGFGWYKSVSSLTIMLDYAYTVSPQIEYSGGSHRLSIGLKI